MKAWEDVCTYANTRGFPHMFALFLTVLAVINALFVGYELYQKKAKFVELGFAVAWAVVMYLNYSNCREWYEIIAWSIVVHIVAFFTDRDMFTRRFKR